MRPVIECEHVRKCYGEIRAVDDVDLTIAAGEVFGLVGPNGAGKTTLIEMIESLRTPDGGSIRVLGLDPVRQADELQEKIGIQLQTTSIQPNITVMEAVSLFGGFYRRAAADPGALLKTLSLEDKSGSRFRKLSGGQQQRVAIALALVNDPEVLFLDELTTGLDPQAPTNMWELVKDIKSRGRTIFLTTHYMEEAEELCDRVGILDHGRIIALDTPENLVRSLDGGSKVLFQIRSAAAEPDEFAELPAVTGAERTEGGFVLYTKDSDATLVHLIRLADTRGMTLQGIRIEIPDMQDVFLKLTGRELRE